MKAITIVAFLALVAIVCADRDAFARFKNKHGRKYRDNDHEERRYANFRHTHDKIERHNRGNHSFTMGHNEFSDLSEDEFRQRFLHEIRYPTPRALPATAPLPSSFPTGPASISFQQYALGVRNQNPCGCCWGYAAAALVETFLRRKSSTYNTFLSTQYLLNCAPNNGCLNGGNANAALEYMTVNGLVSDANYPYTAVQGTCNKNVPKMSQKIAGHYHLNLNANEQQLMNIIAKVGPVVITMQVQPASFQNPNGGIYSDPTCDNTCSKFNHLMLVVGYGADATGKKYWLIKNSWGITWGQAGYIRMIRGGTGKLYNNCNIACHVDYVF